MSIASGWLRLDASERVADGPVFLTGIFVNASVTGATVTLYNAVDVVNQSKIMDIIVGGEETKAIVFNHPLYCENGLYAELDNDIDELTLTWIPGPER